jgi:hypothetical protein
MSISTRSRRAIRRIVAVLSLTAIAYVALLLAPGPLFRYAYAGTAVVLHSDEPLPPEAGEVIWRSEDSLRRSPLFDPTRIHDVYICNAKWRWDLLSTGNKRSGAIALLAPIGRAVITREAHVTRNRVVQASGQEAPNERTLDYYVAHEVTHTMTADFLGPWRFRALPVWVREGYADYVGRGAGFDYDDARAALLGDVRKHSPPQSGSYLRYTLLVAHLLDREGWTVAELLRNPPESTAVEERVRAGRTQFRR